MARVSADLRAFFKSLARENGDDREVGRLFHC